MAEGDFEFAGVDDEGRAELVSRLAHLPKQRGEDSRNRQQRWTSDAGVDGHRLPNGCGNHVEQLLRGQRPRRGEMPDLSIGFLPVSESQQPAGDIR